jgi:D-3-phosphoglycerate dehydrogenase
MYRILVSDVIGAAALDRLAQAPDATVDYRPGLSPSALHDLLPGYDALIIRRETTVTADLLAAAPSLRVIGRAGKGVDNIDVSAATARGIIVTTTPDANSIATAELTMGLMLAAARHLPEAHGSLSAGHWAADAFSGIQLHNRVLGLIGFDRVGRLVAARALAFGMEVIAYDPYISEETARDVGVTLVELDDLLAQSDFISLHTPLSPETHHLIDRDAIALMKDGVILVNTARAGLVDEVALAAGLGSGRVQAAALDVLESEPPDHEHPLIGLPNVIHTPHIGASTQEAEHEMSVRIADQVLAALRGTDYAGAANLPFDTNGDFAEVRPYMELAVKLGRLQAGLAGGPIRRIELEVRGDVVGRAVRAIAAGLLTGILNGDGDPAINMVNAPAVAHARGITTTQTVGMNILDYPNLIACQVEWDGGRRMVAGVLFGGIEPRIVQVDEYRLEAKPDGAVLVMLNRDVPGVIGQVGTILAAYEVNIAEWRLGRDRPGGEALSFINLDINPGDEVIRALSGVKAVTAVRVVNL